MSDDYKRERPIPASVQQMKAKRAVRRNNSEVLRADFCTKFENFLSELDINHRGMLLEVKVRMYAEEAMTSLKEWAIQNNISLEEYSDLFGESVLQEEGGVDGAMLYSHLTRILEVASAKSKM